jgi:hypothetical protein
MLSTFMAVTPCIPAEVAAGFAVVDAKYSASE